MGGLRDSFSIFFIFILFYVIIWPNLRSYYTPIQFK